jgi:hypothetical protein
MTIAMGINFGDYVLLAADTRVTYQIGSLKLGFEDDVEKIQKTSMGIITGAGLVNLLDSVKDRLTKQEITNSDEIIEIVKKEREIWGLNPDFISKTGWLFSYMTLIDNSPKLRLDLVHPSLAEGSVRWEENKLAAIFPIEFTQDQADSLSKTVNELIKSSNEFKSAQESFQYHSIMMREIIKTIQPDCPSVSRCYQVGIHTVSGQVDISKIMNIDEISDNPKHDNQ